MKKKNIKMAVFEYFIAYTYDFYFYCYYYYYFEFFIIYIITINGHLKCLP